MPSSAFAFATTVPILVPGGGSEEGAGVLDSEAGTAVVPVSRVVEGGGGGVVVVVPSVVEAPSAWRL